MKEKISKICKSKILPIVLFLILMLCIECFMTKEGDDVFFSSIGSNNVGVVNFVLERYNTWSSRIVIEAITVIFSAFLPMSIWKIVNVLMYGLLIYSIQKLFIKENKKVLNIIICLLVLFLPFSIFHEAGWIATFNNYLWVAALGLYSLIPIKKVLNKENISIWQAITFVLAILYAANQEQMAGILFLIYTPMILYMIKNKKAKPLIFIMYALIIGSLIFILTCPGNGARTITETAKYYPNFNETSLITKLEQGLTSMMYYVMDRWRLIFFVFLILIAYAMLKQSKDIKSKIIGVSPVGIYMLYNECLSLIAGFRKTEVLANMKIYIAFKVIVYLVTLVLITICLYKIFSTEQNVIKRYAPVYIFLVGFISRFIMAFSPTIYASEERTCLFWYIFMCVDSLLVIQNILYGCTNREEPKAILKT